MQKQFDNAISSYHLKLKNSQYWMWWTVRSVIKWMAHLPTKLEEAIRRGRASSSSEFSLIERTRRRMMIPATRRFSFSLFPPPSPDPTLLILYSRGRVRLSLYSEYHYLARIICDRRLDGMFEANGVERDSRFASRSARHY